MPSKLAKFALWFWLACAVYVYGRYTLMGLEEGWDIWRFIGTYVGLVFVLFQAAAAILVFGLVAAYIYHVAMTWNEPTEQVKQ